MNGTMDDLVYVLATGLENPVINETGIDGTYDARFEVAGGDVDSLNARLKETLGLELVPSNQEMSITVLEVSKQEKSKPSACQRSSNKDVRIGINTTAWLSGCAGTHSLSQA